MTIPTEDVTLTAHYSYNYDPGNPSEPNSTTEKHLNIYGMTSVGAAGQSVIYPVFLENTEDVYGVTVVLRFPRGFTPLTDNVMLGERAAAHTMTVTPNGENAYRFDVTGDQLLTGSNGKIFEVPVTISDTVTTNKSYQVVLSNGARINPDGSKEVISTRSGYIFVEETKEDGLYAQFSYEKLQGRVKFTNLSSDRAISYLWDFGDGTTSTEKNPLHIYATSGYYDVQLTVKGQTGTDHALTTVLINDENTWHVDGVFFLDTEQQGVRYFTTASDLFSFMAATPLAGNIRVMVKSGESFQFPLTEENISKLTTLQSQLAEKAYTLGIYKNGESSSPTLNFGEQGATIDQEIVNLFIALGKNLTCEDVNLKLWNIGFNPSKLDQIKEQTILSGQASAEVDFSQISTDLTFSWTAKCATETASGYPQEGQGNIPSMTAISGSAEDCQLIYNIVASYQGTDFFSFTHTIVLKPALEGHFEELLPADGSRLETTTVKLSWNKINNAVYDVYLWNAANQRPTTPVAEGISELSYLSQNFCQNEKSYKWQVVARNAFQEMASDTMHFSVKMLPDLHIYDLRASGSLTAGKSVTIEWTVRNDGDGSTGTTAWTDRLWLVSDVYAGTSQNGCKLLASLPNVKALASGQEYTGSTEVLLDEQTWGNYYLLVASDMSSVTSIDWGAVGGSIVNPYQPEHNGEGYAHIFATTEASGNLLEEHGETATRCDNFFYKKVEIFAPSVNEADWALLKAAYQQMGNGEGWDKTWNFNSEERSLAGLSGVRTLNSRVVSIDLSSNKLTGAFPYTLLQLAELRTLNVSGNQLAGDLGQGITTFVESLPNEEAQIGKALAALNVSNNKLSGNVGLFAHYLPNLTSLDASKNCFDAVNPVISETVTSLNLKGQSIDHTTTLLLADIFDGSFLTKLPNILLYRHESQNFASDFRMRLEEPEHNWSLVMAYENNVLSMPNVSEQNTYYGQKGDVLRVKVLDSSNKETGDLFNISLGFGDGDANFNGQTDVIDLQAVINYIFESYQEQPFNFTAANMDVAHDAVINVQDVVGMVNLLLETTPSADLVASQQMKTSQRSANEGMTLNTLTVHDGQLMLETNTPVAAFDMVIEGVTESHLSPLTSNLSNMGMTCMLREQEGRVRLIGYSLAGTTLPVGQTVLCSLEQVDAKVVYAKLSDIHAIEILVNTDHGDATGFSEMEKVGTGDGDQIYNLSGQRVSSSQSKSGLYIVNGKKTIFKKK
jgi:PKD repeat protein